MFKDITPQQIEIIRDAASKFPELIDPDKDIDADPWLIALALEKEKQRKLKSNNIVVISRKSMPTEEYLNNLGLSKREKEIIQFLKEKKKITSGDLQRKYKVNRDTANRWLNKLTELNLIERKGKGRTIYYILKEK